VQDNLGLLAEGMGRQELRCGRGGVPRLADGAAAVDGLAWQSEENLDDVVLGKVMNCRLFRTRFCSSCLAAHSDPTVYPLGN
jgi:hypothetical protein